MLTPSDPPSRPTFDDNGATPAAATAAAAAAAAAAAGATPLPNWWQPMDAAADAGDVPDDAERVQRVLEGLNARRMRGDDVTAAHLLELRRACHDTGVSARHQLAGAVPETYFRTAVVAALRAAQREGGGSGGDDDDTLGGDTPAAFVCALAGDLGVREREANEADP